jgi:TorA maturation chaperone TorD
MAAQRKKVRGAIVKKDEKALCILSTLSDDNSEQHFIARFIAEYPKECSRYESAYEEQEKSRKVGQIAPMPTLEIYLKNLYKKMKHKQVEPNNGDSSRKLK